MSAPRPEPPADPGGDSSYANYVLGVLVLVYVFNFLDRQILSILNDHIKAGVEAANLSNSRTKVLVGFPGKLTMHNWVDADRRYTFVLRATY